MEVQVGFVGGQARLGQALEQDRPSDLHFHARGVLPEALVHTEAESDVAALFSADVQGFGVVEDRGVAVCGGQVADDAFSGADECATDFGVPQADSAWPRGMRMTQTPREAALSLWSTVHGEDAATSGRSDLAGT